MRHANGLIIMPIPPRNCTVQVLVEKKMEREVQAYYSIARQSTERKRPLEQKIMELSQNSILAQVGERTIRRVFPLVKDRFYLQMSR